MASRLFFFRHFADFKASAEMMRVYIDVTFQKERIEMNGVEVRAGGQTQFGRPERPIIGILAQKITDKLLHKFYPLTKHRSYIAASYVKFIEAAGARVVPIPDKIDEKNLTILINSINGLLLPGGKVNLVDSHYFKTARKLHNLITDYNHQGGYFPILSICLGFEAMHRFVEKNTRTVSSFNAENSSLPIKLESDFKTSRMFYNLTKELRNALEKKPLTSNFHQEGIDPAWYKKSKKIKDEYRLLATAKDRDGKQFVAAMEGKKYPFYGLQFHPEKPAFEWHPTLDIRHTSEAVKIGQYIADFFVDETRKNSNSFSYYEQEIMWLIDTHPPLHTAFNVNSTLPFDSIYVL
eukprot:gene531-1184_t